MKNNNIVLIEDDSDVREFLCTFLGEQGYNITVAENGTIAKEIISNKQPNLVISDLLLPGEHGLAVIKFIKDKYFLPVIAISGIYTKDELKKDIEEKYDNVQILTRCCDLSLRKDIQDFADYIVGLSPEID